MVAAPIAISFEESADIDIQQEDGKLVVRANGVWTGATVADVDRQLRAMESNRDINADNLTLEVNLSNLTRMDTFGAWLVRRTYTNWKKRGGESKIISSNEDYGKLLRAVNTSTQEEVSRDREPALIRMLNQLGKTVFSVQRDWVLSFNLIGAAIQGPQLKMGARGGIRPAAIVHHIDRMGIRAVPIIALMSFLIGAIIAQQGAYQLRYFGAEIFVVDLASILLLREIGVLLTAIMVAGRTGSAMTAELGSMKMREEVDALQVIGLNPIGVLVFPRLVALTIALPLLTFVADITSLAGAATIALFYSGISIESFISKMHEAVDLSTILSGLIKAPFMAFIIGTISAVEGMKVEGSAESMGRRTTAAVVKSIFFVIVVDGIFAIFYAQIGY